MWQTEDSVNYDIFFFGLAKYLNPLSKMDFWQPKVQAKAMARPGGLYIHTKE
jgi:hypothetical protein